MIDPGLMTSLQRANLIAYRLVVLIYYIVVVECRVVCYQSRKDSLRTYHERRSSANFEGDIFVRI